MTTLANVNASVAALHPYQPGKPVEELARERGIENAVKLASNENPRGPGPQVRKALAAAVDDLSRDPDGSGFRLNEALAARLGVASAQITLGNGSNDVLELAARVAVSPGSNGVVDEHAFVVYPLAIQGAGGIVKRVPSTAWVHDLEGFAAAIDDATRIVYIANPSNPTGTWVDDAAFTRFLRRVPSNVWVVLDEAYAEYVARPDYPDGIRHLADHPNLVVTRTFSKIHGLAALRIGYSVSSPAFADLLNRLRQPFNANSLALAAAEAALQDDDYAATSRRLNAEGMAQLERGFAALGLEWIPSIGNFVTFHVGHVGAVGGAGAERDALAVYDALLNEGVIVRPVANYGMPRHLRATVGLPEENERFLEALGRVVDASG